MEVHRFAHLRRVGGGGVRRIPVTWFQRILLSFFIVLLCKLFVWSHTIILLQLSSKTPAPVTHTYGLALIVSSLLLQNVRQIRLLNFCWFVSGGRS